MILLRAARSTDAGAVGAILSEFIDTTDWMPRIHTRAEDLAHAGKMIERGWVRVAELDGNIVGFSANEGNDLDALYVQAGARGKGVGAALLDDLKQALDCIGLWTFQANVPAQRFYLAHGFVEVRRTAGEANDEGLPDIRYEWQREVM